MSVTSFNPREVADTLAKVQIRRWRFDDLDVVDTLVDLLSQPEVEPAPLVIPRPAKPDVGALAAWHRRLRTRELSEREEARGTWVLDDLYRAACWEAAGDDSWRQRFHRHANGCYATARAYLAASRERAA